MVHISYIQNYIQRIQFHFAETPDPSEHCPRKHGYFAHEQKNICDKFYYCVDGKFNMITCPNGLVYNERAGICSWPDEAKREGCTSEGNFENNSFRIN